MFSVQFSVVKCGAVRGYTEINEVEGSGIALARSTFFSNPRHPRFLKVASVCQMGWLVLEFGASVPAAW